MKSEVEYGENEEGVHVMIPGNSEYTLCGDAFDCYAVDPAVGIIKPTKKRQATCPKCVEILRILKHARSRSVKPK